MDPKNNPAKLLLCDRLTPALVKALQNGDYGVDMVAVMSPSHTESDATNAIAQMMGTAAEEIEVVGSVLSSVDEPTADLSGLDIQPDDTHDYRFCPTDLLDIYERPPESSVCSTMPLHSKLNQPPRRPGKQPKSRHLNGRPIK